jgi:putative ATP-dependent endonuclease of the OLD family
VKLVGLKLKNFRCYQEEIYVQLDNLSCVIGKNDIGKSSILEALNSFFNESIDKEDLSTDTPENTIETTCYFDDLPSSLVLDSSIETSPQNECLLNKDGLLEIKKHIHLGDLFQSQFLLLPITQHMKN